MVEAQTTDEVLNLFDLESLAREKLSRPVFEYYASGSCDEITLRANNRAWSDVFLRPRMLVDVSKRDTSTVVLGDKIASPVLVAPMAFQGLAHAEGELATARAAGKAQTIMVLSTLATYSIEDVMKIATGPIWFQLYIYKDRGIVKNLVERAEQAGCKALVLTVDSPLLGRRERDTKNHFHLPEELKISNLATFHLDKLPKCDSGSSLAKYIASLYDPSLNWKDIEWLRSITNLPILIKGILRGDDAVSCIKSGAKGIIVSNHGGRQLDTAIPTLHALPEIAEAVQGRVEILIDGGIRRGSDVLKAIAFGATAVLVGRPILWALAVDGEMGILAALNILRSELDLAMALSGCPTISSVTPDLLTTRSPFAINQEK